MLPNYRIKVDLRFNGVLRHDFRSFLNAVIYSLISSADPEFGQYLHNQGYNKHRFKLFTFSLTPNDETEYRETGMVPFSGIFTFRFSSADLVCLELMERVLMVQNVLDIGGSVMSIVSINHEPFKNVNSFKIISPVIINGTEKKYLNMMTDRYAFTEAVETALEKRFEMWFGRKETVKATFLNGRKRLLQYKGGNILGYSGRVILRGSPDMLKFAQCAGLGHNTSIGMGMIC